MIELKNKSIFIDQDHLSEFVKTKACSACKHLKETSCDSVCIPCIMDSNQYDCGSNFEQSEIKEGDEK